jgi:hypothetical protein
MDAGDIFAAKKVIAMGSDNTRREQYAKALSLAELAQAIERRQLPALRHGDEYVLRAADVSKLHTRLQPQREMLPSHESQRESLEVGRSA